MSLKRAERDFEAGYCLFYEELCSLEKDLSFLHANERLYYNTLQVDKRRLSYLLGRKAAKKAILELYGQGDPDLLLIEPGVFQFPVVKCSIPLNIQVSISHCDEAGIALAFPEEHPMGIDIECFDADRGDVMKSLVCPGEFRMISNCHLPFSAGCALVWTIKESLSKILRTGLTMDCNLMEIKSMERMGHMYVSTFLYFLQYKAISVISGNYVCSIVLPKNTIPVLDGFFQSFSVLFENL